MMIDHRFRRRRRNYLLFFFLASVGSCRSGTRPAAACALSPPPPPSDIRHRLLVTIGNQFAFVRRRSVRGFYRDRFGLSLTRSVHPLAVDRMPSDDCRRYNDGRNRKQLLTVAVVESTIEFFKMTTAVYFVGS